QAARLLQVGEHGEGRHLGERALALDGGEVVDALGPAADPRGAEAPGGRVAEDRHGVTADVDRRGDRGDHLVPAEDAPVPGGPVATGGDPAGDRGATPAARLGIAEDADGVAADVDRRGDRGDHLVATQDAPGARGAVATGRDARLHHRAPTAAGEGDAEDADGVAADVDRRGDRGDHLVATQDAPGARGAVATGRDAALHHRTATAAGEDVAEDADGVAADVDRRGDRGDHLVATQDAPGARGAVATGRDARLVL